MPRRYYRKKKFTKKSKTFSKYNLYKRRSAKSQAYQIGKLNKKVNSIYRRVKPDILRYEPSVSDYTIANWISGSLASQTLTLRGLNTLLNDSKYSNVDYVNIRDYYLNLKLKYKFPPTTLGTPELSASPIILARMVIIQYRQDVESGIPLGDVFQGTGLPAVLNPLKEHINERGKILCDKVLRLTPAKQVLNINYHVPRYRNKRIQIASTAQRLKNEIELEKTGVIFNDEDNDIEL